jgi:16S rRNA processing protein RimM
MIAREELVHIGKITKSHGLNGELEINVNSELFEECETPYIVAETDGIFIPFFIEEYRYKNENTYLFSFKGIENEVDFIVYNNYDSDINSVVNTILEKVKGI